MNKRDLERLVCDANWSKLYEVVDNTSEAKLRSTMTRLIDIFADVRVDKYVKGKLIRGNFLYASGAYLLLLFKEGRYIESRCITSTNHIKRFIKKNFPSITDEEVEGAKSALYKEKIWAKDGIELQLEYKDILSE